MEKKAVTTGELIIINNALYFLVNKLTKGMDIYNINKMIYPLKKEALAFEATRKKINKKYLKKGQKELERGSEEELKASDELKEVRGKSAGDFEYNKIPLNLLDRISFKENEGAILVDIMFLFEESKEK